MAIAERNGIRMAPALSKRRDSSTAFPPTCSNSWEGVAMPARARQGAAPRGGGGGAANGPEEGLPRRRRKAAAGQCEGGLDREAIGIGEPFRRVLEHDGLVASNLVAAGQADRPCAALEVDV